MKIGNTHIIKFTKQDIKKVYLQSHKWDTWAEIKLKSGSDASTKSNTFPTILECRAIINSCVGVTLLISIIFPYPPYTSVI